MPHIEKHSAQVNRRMVVPVDGLIEIAGDRARFVNPFLECDIESDRLPPQHRLPNPGRNYRATLLAAPNRASFIANLTENGLLSRITFPSEVSSRQSNAQSHRGESCPTNRRPHDRTSPNTP